jgi:hypothetical protein
MGPMLCGAFWVPGRPPKAAPNRDLADGFVFAFDFFFGGFFTGGASAAIIHGPLICNAFRLLGARSPPAPASTSQPLLKIRPITCAQRRSEAKPAFNRLPDSADTRSPAAEA